LGADLPDVTAHRRFRAQVFLLVRAKGPFLKAKAYLNQWREGRISKEIAAKDENSERKTRKSATKSTTENKGICNRLSISIL
jgi:hypothetical protein